MSLYHYLPVYPDFTNKLEDLLGPDSGDSKDSSPPSDSPYQSLYHKSELRQYILPTIEERPAKQGILLRHQAFMARLMSSYSPYNGILLMHDPGTGKTCTAIGVIEAIRSQRSAFTGALILMKGKKMIQNFMSELLYRCTERERYWTNDDYKTDEQNLRLAQRNVRQFYEFQTFEKISRWIRDTSPDAVAAKYSNHIIVIDEVHNLRDADRENQYRSIHTLLHLVANTKVLLMSGTPMRDRPDELQGIMNLILPSLHQISDFSRFVSPDGTANPATIGILKQEYLQGRVSYVKAMSSNVVKEYVGSFDLGSFRLNVTRMSGKQLEVYRALSRVDEKKAVTNETEMFTNHRQISLCVAPNGKYGRDGFGDNGDGGFFKTLATELQKMPGNPDALQPYSTKYADTIRALLRYPNDSHFIYCDLVSGSGLKLFAHILAYFGYVAANTPRGGGDRRKRFALATGDTTDTSLLAMINEFNDDSNRHGELIQVFMGSQVISEGFTLKNVKHIHILTPHWNFSETDQAIARAIRYQSHAALEREHPNQPVAVTISLSCSAPDEPTIDNSIDFKMWSYSQDKDKGIKSFERVLKESCVDCIFNRERNRNQIAVDGSRECDYEKCDYQCDGGPFQDAPLDSVTHQLYYDVDQIVELCRLIPVIFHERRAYHMPLQVLYDDIQRRLGASAPTLTTVIKAVLTIIRESRDIPNHLGVSCVMRSENDHLYLTHNLRPTTNSFDSYYAANFFIHQARLDETALVSSANRSLKEVRLLLDRPSVTDLRNVQSFLPEVQLSIIEVTLLLQREQVETSRRDAIEFLVKLYQPYIARGDGVIALLLLDLPMRCLSCSDQNWRTCSTSHPHHEALLERLTEQSARSTVPPNQWGYAGLFDLSKLEKAFQDDHDRYPFYIYKITDDVGQKMKRGFVCHQTYGNVIMDIAQHLGIVVGQMPDQRKKPVCDSIRKWFIDHDLVYNHDTFAKIDLRDLPPAYIF